jgi:ureidoacrylate peracid hydrolase
MYKITMLAVMVGISGCRQAELNERFGYFFDIIERETISNMQKIQTACRASQIEVMYTVIEKSTKDALTAA